jgi:serine/threonine protein kinase
MSVFTVRSSKCIAPPCDELMTGRRPFAEDVPTRLCDQILHDPPPAPRLVSSRVSPEVERIVLKCLEKQPENRYQSAKELAIDLRRLSSSTTPVPVRSSRKHLQWLRGIGIEVGVVVLLGLASNSWRNRSDVAGPIVSIAVLPLRKSDSSRLYTGGLTPPRSPLY